MERIVNTVVENLNRENIMKYWKDYITEYTIVVIEKAVKTIKSETINSCWRKLCSDVVHGFTGFTTEPIKEIMKEIMDMAGKKEGSEGFQDMGFGEIQELKDTTPEKLTEDSLMETNASKPVPDDEEKDMGEAVSENKLILDNLTKKF
uniref:Uncharacterized protein n=1 Tax=Rousettus aegyptiacus TaxID=9407 RepID=A0A7J8DIQ3_ROUAE|nr:hypothetical protein HJG63_008597 [Rousettus aegyptiacus]